MNFQGLVFTDDLDMGAIVKHYPLPVIVEQCLRATVDILLICHAGPNIEAALNHILYCWNRIEGLIVKGEASLKRILRFKESYLKMAPMNNDPAPVTNKMSD